MTNSQIYKRLATAIAVLTLMGLCVKCYDRFTTVEAMARQSQTDITENKDDVASDIKEIKDTLKRMDDKIDKVLLK